MTTVLTRRGTLGTAAGALAAAALAACTKRSTKPPAGTTRQHYGKLGDQFGDLYLPSGTPRGTVVLMHGGFWLADYTLDLMVPIGKALARAGWAVWNLEYRRLDAGGGYPSTFVDVAAGVDHLTKLRGVDHFTKLRGVDRGRVVLLGHSAGGHLAAWAASRTDKTPGGPPKVGISGVVSLAGVLDLVGGARDNVGNGAIQQLMGGTPEAVPARYALGDPLSLAPAPCPVACLHGTDDDVVPATQSTGYVKVASKAGGTASYDQVPGTHFTIIDPNDRAWATTSRLVARLAGPS
ncbi:MAG: alpha/beta hydrolase [Marmoricola sp.]